MTTEHSRPAGRHIIICGAGIGGLSAALCCAHFGFGVTVLEQAKALGEVGAGIQIPPNAMKVFEALGLTAFIERDAFEPEAIECRMGESGMPLFEVPLGNAAQKRWGSAYLHIHRADYIRALKDAIAQKVKDGADITVKTNAEVTGFTQESEQVRVHLKSGEAVNGTALIGADGIHSVIRTQMLGPDKPRFTGNVAWRVTAAMDKLGEYAPKPTACAWMGRGRHAVTYRLRRGEIANFVGVVERDDWTSESWSQTGDKADALSDFDGWHPTITTLLRAAEPGQLYRWALFDRLPIQRWTDGRVALLGDAAHPMLPFMAQGAAMAVEDAWQLASMLASTSRVGDALQAYETVRKPRTSQVQAASRDNAKTFHKSTSIGRLTTYGPMWLAGRIAPPAVRARLDWLYAFDVTGAE